MNTKETTELLRFSARLGNAVDKTIEDGKVTATDIQYLFDPLFAAGSAFAGFNLIDDEIADLDDTEATDLVNVIRDELDIHNNHVEELSEEGLALAIAIVRFVNKIREAKNA